MVQILDDYSSRLLKDEKLLELLCEEIAKSVEGETDTVQAILLCANGRNVKNHNVASYNLLVNSESGAGKDHVVANTLKILPADEYIKKTRISPAVFTYWNTTKVDPSWTWDKKAFYCEDVSSGVLNSDVFKVMCSGGSNATIVINQQAVDLQIRGKPVIIITTANATPNKELTRRFSIANLNESIDQTRAIMKRIARDKQADEDPRIRKALTHLKRVNVRIPFAEKLVKFFPSQNIIMRTHFPRFLDFIKASCSLHQYQRETDKDGYFLATGQDYDIARNVLLKTTSNALMIPLALEQRKILAVFDELRTGKKQISKFQCENCERVCETDTCPKCKDYDKGSRITFPAVHYVLERWSVADLLPLCAFFTGSERWFRHHLAVLTSYGFLEMITEKRSSLDKPVNVYSCAEQPNLNIPSWEEIEADKT